MKNKEIKLPTSVENNIISIINIIEKIYKIKFTELSLLTTKIDNNTEEVRNQILEVRNLLRNQMEICDDAEVPGTVLPSTWNPYRRKYRPQSYLPVSPVHSH